jgi:hypothetical protein
MERSIMVYMNMDAPAKKGDIRERTFCYDRNNPKDIEIIKKIDALLNTQSTCFNCENFYYEGCLGGYQAASCKLYGCIEVVGHPHYDCDGSKCKDYKRKVTIH